MKDRLKECCKALGTDIEELAEISGVSVPTLYNINNGANTTVEVINKIYTATKDKFGIGLVAQQYLDIHK